MNTNLEKRNALKAALSKDEANFISSAVAHDPKFYFMDGFVGELIAEGFPVLRATMLWATAYKGENKFVLDVAPKVSSSKLPSLKQARALLNCAMKDAQEKGTPSSCEVVPEKRHACFVCGDKFATVKEAADHRVATHSHTPPAPKPPRDDWETAIRSCRACDFKGTLKELREHRKVHYAPLFEAVPQSGLDLERIGVGRFAIPMVEGDDFYFLSIGRVHKTKTRSKKYRYGFVTYGTEEVAAGTLEVRKWHGEAKELIGEQRPGETYRGDLVSEVELILADPVASTKLFGAIHKRCGRCGTSLTDPASRARAIGPECIKHFPDSVALEAPANKEALTERMRELRKRSSAFTVVGAGTVSVPEELPEAAPFSW